MGNLFDELREYDKNNSEHPSWRNYRRGEKRGGKIVAEYLYFDAESEFYLRVQRTTDKQFPQSYWDKAGQQWVPGKPKGLKIPYNLPEIIAAPPTDLIVVCEGEKDADNGCAIGLLTTTNSEGAGKWTADLNKWFVGKDRAAITADNDDAGQKHARLVARNLLSVGVKDVRVIHLPGLDEKGDLTDWIEAGGTNEKFLDLWKTAPLYNALQLDPSDPMRSASAIVAEEYTENGTRTLHHHRGAFWEWTGACYREADEDTIRARIWTILDAAVCLRGMALVPFKPKPNHVNAVIDALKAICQLDLHIAPPTWLNGSHEPKADELFAVGNGLLHLPTRTLHPPTPNYFNLSASDVIFDSNAPRPDLWIEFINETLGDAEAVRAMQEWCGYTIASDTSQQKILLNVGPRRSGKGTTARVLTMLAGRHSVAGPTMSSLGAQFGLEPLITKPLAIVSDARIGTKTDKSAIVERLLSISGEDTLTVDRKFKSAWHGQLPTRFMVLTNELPSLSEGSGALSSRFIMILFPNSMYGKEDRNLTSKLINELPGILNWAINGYDSLRDRGHFLQPANAQEQLDQIEMLGAPVKAFVKDCCFVEPGRTATLDALYEAWRNWCDDEGRRDPGTRSWFSRNLHSTEPGLRISRPRAEAGDVRLKTYEGIGLKSLDGIKAARRAERDKVNEARSL